MSCLICFLSVGGSAELDQLAVDEGARVAARRELLEEVDELALLLRDDRARAPGSGCRLELHELVGDLLHRLALDLLAADRAVRHADARPEQAHVVVDLGDRADRRARVAVRRLLVDRDGGAQALDEVDVGAVDLAEELARVGGQRLDVAALALGEDRVEREARLARPGEPGEDDERITRDLEVDVLQVVDPGAADAERGGNLLQVRWTLLPFCRCGRRSSSWRGGPAGRWQPAARGRGGRGRDDRVGHLPGRPTPATGGLRATRRGCDVWREHEPGHRSVATIRPDPKTAPPTTLWAHEGRGRGAPAPGPLCPGRTCASSR